MRSLNAETFLRLKSASRPWPTASCSRMPGQPGPSTTVVSPAGASTASSCTMACRAASRAKCSGVFSLQKKRQLDASAAARISALRRAAALPRQRRNAQPRHRLPVETQNAGAGGDHHVAQAVGVGGLHLKNARIVGARGARRRASPDPRARRTPFRWARSAPDTDFALALLEAESSRLSPDPAAMQAATRAALRIFSGLRSSL